MSKRQDFKRLNTRQASIVEVGGFRPSGDPFASNFGLQAVGVPGQLWPRFEEQAMLFVCQLNLTEAPVIPASLEDIKLITFFTTVLGGLSKAQENGHDWRLFAHTSLDGLVPIIRPADASRLHRGAECRWTLSDDHPEFDDPERQPIEGFDDSEVELENIARTKIGGYASTIQSEPWWHLSEHRSQPGYCLQINSEEKVGLMFGDAGIVYLARGTAEGSKDEWFLDGQCY
ncbi:MAG TPA: DUF1963 domain-containing protein [Bryobacteraceae bacterium]|jgi:hypothetical protein